MSLKKENKSFSLKSKEIWNWLKELPNCKRKNLNNNFMTKNWDKKRVK